MARKRQFHCEKCKSPCEIYRKGKSHRVLVCPECGVLASNPLPLVALAAAKIGAKAVKGIAQRGSLGGKKRDEAAAASTTQRIYNIDTYTAQERVADALR